MKIYNTVKERRLKDLKVLTEVLKYNPNVLVKDLMLLLPNRSWEWVRQNGYQIKCDLRRDKK